MPNPFGAPEVTVQDVATKYENKDEFILLDVREPEEYAISIREQNVLQVPLSRIAEQRMDAFPHGFADKNMDDEIIVFCHHGMRSAQVTAWLKGQGFTNVHNMDGGIDAWAHGVDASVGTY